MFTDDRIVSVENLKKLTQKNPPKTNKTKTLLGTNNYSKVVGNKVNIKKSITFQIPVMK